MTRPAGRPAGRPPTWWLLVRLDLPELNGYRLRAIGPLSWSGVRSLGERWEQEFGAGTTAFTERPPQTAWRAAVGARPAPVLVAAAPVPRAKIAAPAEAPRAMREAVRSLPDRLPQPPAPKRRAPGPSRLSPQARAALARTRAALAAVSAEATP